MTSKIITALIALVILAAIGYYFFLDTSSGMGASTSATTTSQTGATAYDQAMIGTWRSTDDAKFTRTFSADGTVIDAYEGEPDATESGHFTVATPTSDPNFPAQAADFAGTEVIRIDFAKSGTMYFAINKLDSGSLQMTYLDRGNLLSFTRVQ